METNEQRIRRDIEFLREITATPEEGVARFSLSSEDKKARKYLIKAMVDIGLKIKIEPPGNIRARLIGTEPLKLIVMVGSHNSGHPGFG